MSQLSQQQHSVWTEHLQNQHKSGLTRKAYCEANKLNYHQFGYWKKKASSNEASSNKSKPSMPSGSQSKFVSVNLSAPVSADLTLSLPNGIVLSGINESNHTLAASMMDKLI